LLYIGQSQTLNPRTDLIPTKHRRNEDIRARYAAGDPVRYIAKLYEVSEQRVSQIVHGQRD
jgi:Mor family transcriptional regulator